MAETMDPFAGGLPTSSPGSKQTLFDASNPFAPTVSFNGTEQPSQRPKSALSRKMPERKKLRVTFPAKLFTVIATSDDDMDAVDENYVLYQTLYAYNSGEEGDLAFEENEILQVTDEGDGPKSWFYGKAQDGREGAFPGTFVRKIVTRSKSLVVDSEKGVASVLEETPRKRELQPHEYVCYQALFDFQSEEDGDLSFKANDILRVTDEGDGPKSWFYGQDQEGNEGAFPGTFVRKIKMKAPKISFEGLEHA
eukprot:m.80172 g.80172  ORF g.80172 m.80172 type:complete len:251 (+) comp12595_c0_seq1:872-1624(+)